MKRAIGSLAMLFAALFASPVHADPTPQERALADSLFRDAKGLVAAGKVSAACPKFAESLRLDRQIGTLLYLATCHQAEGKTASAWAEYNQVASEARAAAQPERETIARSRAALLEPMLARLAVRVSAPAEGEELRIDGTLIGRSAWDTSLPVDPGPHVVEASAPGRVTVTLNIAAEASREIALEVPALAMVVKPLEKKDTVTPPPSSDERQGDGHRTIGWVTLGVGGAGLVVGSIFGVIAISDKSSAASLGNNGGCINNRCVQPVLDKESAARTAGWVSTAGFAVGIAAAAAGVYLVLTSPNGAPKTSAWITPRIGPHDAWLGGGLSF